jgi:hypothetical protein
MSRLGYLVLITLIVSLASYVFWPQQTEDPSERIWIGAPPSRYAVTFDSVQQNVEGEVVRFGEHERPLETSIHDRLWNILTEWRWFEKNSVAGIGEDRLAEYGISDKREIKTDGLLIRWGVKDNTFYLWDGRKGRVYSGEKILADELDKNTRWLYQRRLLDLQPFTRLSINTTSLTLDRSPAFASDPQWRDALRPERPFFNARVNRLYDLISVLRLDTLALSVPKLRVPDHTIRFAGDDVTQAEHTLRLWWDNNEAIVQVDNLPAQKIVSDTTSLWKDVLTDLSNDYLFALYEEFARQPLAEIQVSRNGAQLFRLEKHGLQDAADKRSNWDVIWSLDRVRVRDARVRVPSETVPTDATVITFIFQQNRRQKIIVYKDKTIFSPTHVATAIDMPELLSDIMPDRMLDPALTFRGAERVIKIQRQWHQGPHAGRAEVVAAQGGVGEADSLWQQTYPADKKGQPISTMAVDQVARALCTAQGKDVRLSSARDRAALAAPYFEMDMRFAPIRVRLSNDHSRLVDTSEADLGFAFVSIDGGWRAIDKDGGVSYGVSDELMELLQASLMDNVVVPLIPSLVTRVDINGPTERLRLRREQDTWQLTRISADGTDSNEKINADNIAVRRYLRLIAATRAEQSDEHAGPFTPAELRGSVVCIFPGAEQGDTRVTMSLGPSLNGLTAVVVEGGAGMRGLPRGRVYVRDEFVQGIFPSQSQFAAQKNSTP